jgi:hypothetical protein
MLHVLLFLALLTIIWAVVSRKIRDKLNIEKRTGLYRHINRYQLSGEVYIFIIMFLFLFFIGPLQPHYIFLGLIIPLGSYRTFMEWKYDKASKQFVLSLFNTAIFLIAFTGILLFTLPKNIDHTYSAYIFSEDGEISEMVKIEMIGKLKRSPLQGDIFEGHIYMLDKEFFTIKYGRTNLESIYDSLIDNRLFYTLIGTNRGEMWTSRGIHSFAGKINGVELKPEYKTTIKFSGPAETLEEAKELYKKLSQD